MKHYKLLKLIGRLSIIGLVLIAFIIYIIGNWNLTVHFPPFSLIFVEIGAQLTENDPAELGNKVLLWFYIIIPLALAVLAIVLNYKRNTLKQGYIDALLSLLMMFVLLFFQSYFWSYISKDYKEGYNIGLQMLVFLLAMLAGLIYAGLVILEVVWVIQNKESLQKESQIRRDKRKPTYIVNPVISHSPAFDSVNKEIAKENVEQKKNEETINNLDLLLKYKQLLDNGIITEEEFNEKKTKLLK